MPDNKHDKDRADILARIDAWSRALEARDIPGMMADYTEASVLFDATPPGKTVGATAIAALWAQCLPYFPAVFRSEHTDLTVEVDGDVAFAHMLHHFVTEPADHPCGQSWMRVTACYRRVGGAWRVAHEHVSLPFDPMTGKVIRMGGDGEALPTPPAVTATPHLTIAGAADAIDFYVRAFGATEMMRLPAPDGRLLHGAITIGGALVMVCDAFPEMGGKAPPHLGGTPVTIALSSADVDAAAARAIAAGAKVIMPVADMFWGDRYGLIEDPFGHRWSLATTKKTLSEAELRAAAAEAMAHAPDCQGN